MHAGQFLRVSEQALSENSTYLTCINPTTMEGRSVGEQISSVPFRYFWIRSPKPYLDGNPAQNPIDSVGCYVLILQHPHSAEPGGR